MPIFVFGCDFFYFLFLGFLGQISVFIFIKKKKLKPKNLWNFIFFRNFEFFVFKKNDKKQKQN